MLECLWVEMSLVTGLKGKMVSSGLTMVGTAMAPIETMLFWTRRCSEETIAGGRLNTADGVNHFTAHIPNTLLKFKKKNCVKIYIT